MYESLATEEGKMNARLTDGAFEQVRLIEIKLMRSAVNATNNRTMKNMHVTVRQVPASQMSAFS